MTYNKPEVVKLDSALGVIQGGGQKGINSFTDALRPHNADALTVGAYEADE